jgi:hypothetical protein
MPESAAPPLPDDVVPLPPLDVFAPPELLVVLDPLDPPPAVVPEPLEPAEPPDEPDDAPVPSSPADAMSPVPPSPPFPEPEPVFA